ncbi:MAG: hypothetical protein IJA66_03375 [Alistipes sp.]|nr:hypothetical protein [Alistipes sp.]
MMNTLTYIYYIYTILLAATLIVLIAWAQVVKWRTNHLHRFEKLLSQRYMRIVTAIILSNESLPSRFPMIEHRGAKEILSRVLAKVASAVYGPDAAIIGRIASDNGIDRWLLQQAKRHRGFRRAEYISRLASIPATPYTISRIDRYSDDSNRFTRFYALIIRIAADTSSALRELAEYPQPLNGFEVAEVMALLRRGLLPVACEPLLTSKSHNLRIIGLNIAKVFGMSEVKPLLLDIAVTDSNESIAHEALHTLISMHSSLAHSEIAECIHSLTLSERRSLCRYLAFEGYSASALERLFGNLEGRYAERLVATYKRRIVCIPQL